MGVRHEPRLFDVELALFVYQRLVDIYGHDLGDEHIVAPLGNDLSHPALNGNGRLGYLRRRHGVALHGYQLHLRQLILVLSGSNPAVIHGAHQGGGHHVYNELAALLNDII